MKRKSSSKKKNIKINNSNNNNITTINNKLYSNYYLLKQIYYNDTTITAVGTTTNLTTNFNNLKKIQPKIKPTPHAYVAGETHVCIVIEVVVPDVSVPPLQHDETALVCDIKEPL